MDTQDRDRTVTGITLAILGFALSWIPYVSYVGGLLALIGVVFLYLGRGVLDDRHRRLVVAGAVLVFFEIVAAFVAGLVVAATLIGAASTASTPSQLTGTLTSTLDGLFVSSAILSYLAALAWVLLVYALVDDPTRRLLWVAFVAQVIVSTSILFLLLPQVNSAISNATSGSTIDTGPITQLEATALLWGLLNAIPSMLFLWGYLRARRSAQSVVARPASPWIPPPLSPPLA